MTPTAFSRPCLRRVARRVSLRVGLVLACACLLPSVAWAQSEREKPTAATPLNSVLAVKRYLAEWAARHAPASGREHDAGARAARAVSRGRRATPVRQVIPGRQDAQAAAAPGRITTNSAAARADGDEPEEREGGPEWLDAYLFYLQQRAYPRDSMDLTALARAADHRDRMPAARALGRPALGAARLADKWAFVGPRKLEAPYRQYYGTGPIAGRINAVAFDPKNSQTIYISAAGGGFWKSTDAGATWTCLSDSWKLQQAGSIAIDPKVPDTIYVATGDSFFSGNWQTRFLGDGIYKTTDGGATWTLLSTHIFGHIGISKILIDPDDHYKVLVTTGPLDSSSTSRIWRSTDAGASWEAPPTAPRVCWTEVAAGSPTRLGRRYLYACGFIPGAGSVLYRSADGGETWTKLWAPYLGGRITGIDVAASPHDSDTLYLLEADKKRIWKSTDAGGAWTNITAGFPGGPNSYNWSQAGYNTTGTPAYDYFLGCSTATTAAGGKTDVLYVGLIDVAQSRDGGATWQSIGGPSYVNGALTHNDQHAWTVDPSNPDSMLVGNDGGVYSLTYSPGASTIGWNSLNAELGISQFYKLAVDQVNADTILGGTQDNAGPAALGKIDAWANKGGGDSGWVGIDPSGSGAQYAAIAQPWTTMWFNWTTDNWAHKLQAVFTFTNPVVPFLFPLLLDPSDPQRVYMGTNTLLSWTPTNPTSGPGPTGSSALTSQYLLTIAVSCDGQAVYTGSVDGQIWASFDQGQSWTNITGGTPGLAVTSIAVSPRSRYSILAGFSGSGSPHMWQCANTQNPSWVSVSGSGTASLPDISLNAIALDPNDPTKTWYVGTDGGCMQTSDGGTSWQNITRPLGLPNVQVNDLQIDNGGAYLYAATFGRGIWRIGLSAPTSYSVADIAVPTPDPQSYVQPTTINNCGIVAGYFRDQNTFYQFAFPNTAGHLAIVNTGNSAIIYEANCEGQMVGVGGQNPPGIYNLYGGGAVTALSQLYVATGINAYGQVVGSSGNDSPTVWTPSTPNGSAGNYATLPGGSVYPYYLAINDSAEVVGVADDGSDTLLLCALSNGHYTATRLAPIAGANLTLDGYYINDEGIVALTTEEYDLLTDEPITYANVWIPTARNGSAGAFVELPDLGFANTEVAGINKYGEIVGLAAASNDANLPLHAVAWVPGANGYTIVDLNTQLPANSGWFLEEANGINDSGQICGLGVSPAGSDDGFLLTPKL